MPELKATHRFIVTLSSKELSRIIAGLIYIGNDETRSDGEDLVLAEYLKQARAREAREWAASLPLAEEDE